MNGVAVATATPYTNSHALTQVAKPAKSEPKAELWVAEPSAPKTIGSDTFLDLPQGDPPPQLVAPFLNQEGVTVLYGPGGVGKGTLSTYFALMLVRQGRRVMVLDYEGHRGEWGRRARAMGYTDNELAGVEYREPYGDTWTEKRGALIDTASLIRADCDDLHIDFLIVDSFTAATTTGDALGGAAAAQEFYRGIKMINLPALVLAHVRGAAGRFPDRPFGTTFVHNFARETWAVEKINVEDTYDPGVEHLKPTTMSLELRNNKMNAGPQPPPQFITFSYWKGTIEFDRVQPTAGRTKKDLVADILGRTQKPMTDKAILVNLKADFGETMSGEHLPRWRPDPAVKVKTA